MRYLHPGTVAALVDRLTPEQLTELETLTAGTSDAEMMSRTCEWLLARFPDAAGAAALPDVFTLDDIAYAEHLHACRQCSHTHAPCASGEWLRARAVANDSVLSRLLSRDFRVN